MEVDNDEFFREVTLRISSSLEIGDALLATMAYLERFIPMDTMGLYYFDREQMAVFAVAEVKQGGTVRVLQDMLPSIPVDAEILALLEAPGADESLLKVHNRPDTQPRAVLDVFPELATCSVVSFPLSIEGEMVGGLSISVQGFDRYTEEHVVLLNMVKDPIALAMSNARRYRELARLKDLLTEDNRALSMDLERVAGARVVGADFGLRQVMDMVRRIAPMASPALLLGETGTGKEVIANAIHLASPRREGPMVRVQCGAIPDSLLDSELFGHEKGAFTGATTRKRGRFERADGGTIFLDEIGELTLDAQVKLLRVLQEKEFERLGGTQTIRADVRVIAATHRDLGQRVRDGRFREDLWYRLNVFPIQIPPLRMRTEDLPSLVQHFVERKAREMNLETVPALPTGAIARLQAYGWPGNVRELQNVIERALILSRGGPLCFPDLTSPPTPDLPAVSTALASDPTTPTLDAVMTDHIRRVLLQTQGRVAGPGAAAERLGLNPSTLRSKMRKLGIALRRPTPAIE